MLLDDGPGNKGIDFLNESEIRNFGHELLETTIIKLKSKDTFLQNQLIMSLGLVKGMTELFSGWISIAIMSSKEMVIWG